ncbi:hypothetical protein HGG82_09760 [Marinomonas sp. M1K-6]|uniref:Uncharacterized protein n=1 Tax=Marinomonas profundi TaxID=2726122 RepID=A0A847R2A4_9GAMM|nr:hypothetical protein [Marinomonas profundi]NLQ17912.1 hypothetical protein [Marinomonas profundi]UDV03432.1 hypothetical protein J8N69_01150 [Marinomonas profundi]
MRILFIKSTIILVGCAFISLAHSNDLIAFGKACLVKEARLNKAKSRLDILSLREQSSHAQSNQALNYLQHYRAEKATLETAMTDCAETTPNSAYCHQIRHRYNELNYLIQRAKADKVEEDLAGNDSHIDYEITRANFHQRYEAFVAYCRNSDAHYALIQNPTAYAAVCSSEDAKPTITCSLF